MNGNGDAGDELPFVFHYSATVPDIPFQAVCVFLKFI
jgi:hypothetical protein